MTAARRAFLIVALAIAGGWLLLLAVRHLSGGSLEVIAAEYGVSGRTCTAGPAIKKRVSEACDGLFRPRCLVSVSSAWCGDPAPGVVKTLTVDYMCGSTRKRASAVEYTALTLACP